MATVYETQFATSAWAQLAAMFGETVTYYAGGTGGGASITAIWMPQGTDPEWQEDGKYAPKRGMIQCAQANVATPTIKDTFSIDSTTYAVESITQESPVVIMSLVDIGREYLGGQNTYAGND